MRKTRCANSGTLRPVRCRHPFVGLLCGVAAWGFRLLIGLVHNVAFFGQSRPTTMRPVHTAESAGHGWSCLYPCSAVLP